MFLVFFKIRYQLHKPYSTNTNNGKRKAWKMSTLQKSLFWQWLRKSCLQLPFQHGLESQIKTQKHSDSKGNTGLLWRAANPSKIVNNSTGQKKLPFPLRKSQEKQEHATAHYIIHIKPDRKNSSAEESKIWPQFLTQVQALNKTPTISTSF